MLIPILTAKGTTKTCLKKYKLDDTVNGTYSNNGWTNNGIIKIALEQIYSNRNFHLPIFWYKKMV